MTEKIRQTVKASNGAIFIAKDAFNEECILTDAYSLLSNVRCEPRVKIIKEKMFGETAFFLFDESQEVAQEICLAANFYREKATWLETLKKNE